MMHRTAKCWRRSFSRCRPLSLTLWLSVLAGLQVLVPLTYRNSINKHSFGLVLYVQAEESRVITLMNAHPTGSFTMKTSHMEFQSWDPLEFGESLSRKWNGGEVNFVTDYNGLNFTVEASSALAVMTTTSITQTSKRGDCSYLTPDLFVKTSGDYGCHNRCPISHFTPWRTKIIELVILVNTKTITNCARNSMPTYRLLTIQSDSWGEVELDLTDDETLSDTLSSKPFKPGEHVVVTNSRGEIEVEHTLRDDVGYRYLVLTQYSNGTLAMIEGETAGEGVKFPFLFFLLLFLAIDILLCVWCCFSCCDTKSVESGEEPQPPPPANQLDDF